MKITDKTKKPTPSKSLSSLTEGTVFSGKIGTRRSIFLVAYGIIVDLCDSCNTWSNYNLSATEYEELDAELIVRPKKNV